MDGVGEADGTGGVRVRLHVQPGARRPGVGGRHGDALRVRVAAAAEGGRANRAVVDALAEALDLPRRAVSIERGHTGRRKIVRVACTDPAAVLGRLAELAGG